MLTSAGVSAIDGNHKMPSGIWGEFRQKLYDYYGGPKAVATGWVSHTLFEPSVGKSILTEMANLDNLEIEYKASFDRIEKMEDKWLVRYKKKGKSFSTKASILIDATGNGGTAALGWGQFSFGNGFQSGYWEKEAPENANSIVQDLTYVAILKDVGDEKNRRGLVKNQKTTTRCLYLVPANEREVKCLAP